MKNTQQTFSKSLAAANLQIRPALRPFGYERAGKGKAINVFVSAILASMSILLASCGDERTPPADENIPAYTETILLWQDELSGGNVIQATFSVDQPLAAINNPGTDHPARLTLVGYIQPDGDILRFEELAYDSVPTVTRQETGYQARIDAFVTTLDSMFRIDTSFTANCPPCALCPCTTSCEFDTCGFASIRSILRADSFFVADTLALVRAYKSRLEQERDSVGILVDDRYALSIWLDDATTPAIFPIAFYIDSSTVNGQGIYLARTDTTTGFKGRGFVLNMDGFFAADPNPINYGYSYRINWAECFSGNPRCLSPGQHTLYARLEGAANTRITGTVVLTYAGERP